uniref:Uncharacterized protein n=1 Tax=Ananas comosus var. bracteatus TaxID=296719 RepID=A0A6V7NW65_ANACO|nr:unnamed protein product [Ananas comosus var. bracteatus]
MFRVSLHVRNPRPHVRNPRLHVTNPRYFIHLIKITIEGDDNDGNEEDAPIHNDGNQEDAPIHEDDDWNNLAADIEDDHDGGLNCLANAVYSVNDDPHINNEYNQQ